MSGAGVLDLAFLGCGSATDMHSRTLSRVDPEVRLHYASRDSARAAAFRDRHRGAGAFGSYREAVEADGVDTLLVATPPALHLEWTLRALEAGKDVIVEKPAFPRPEDFRSVRRAASDAGRRVLVAENYFYKPLRRRLARVLSEGLVGEPLLLQVNAIKRQEVRGWRGDPALAGGGALLEGGVHWISFMAELGMEPARICGHRAGGAGRPGEGAGPETVVVVVEYAGGAVGTLSYSWEVPSPLKGARISKLYGRKGSVTFESNGGFVFVHGRRIRFWVPGPLDFGGYKAMFRDFLDALRTGREPEMTLAMAERDVRLVWEAYGERAAGAGDDET